MREVSNAVSDDGSPFLTESRAGSTMQLVGKVGSETFRVSWAFRSVLNVSRTMNTRSTTSREQQRAECRQITVRYISILGGWREALIHYWMRERTP
jgi:hypothetical protein